MISDTGLGVIPSKVPKVDDDEFARAEDDFDQVVKAQDDEDDDLLRDQSLPMETVSVSRNEISLITTKRSVS